MGAVKEKQTEASSMGLGTRIRTVREAMGLSLRDLSERCGVSSAMISQVEREETSPTITVAERMAQGLGINLSQLLRLGEAEPFAVVRENERQKGRAKAGHSYEVVTPQTAGQRYLVSIHKLKEGSTTGGMKDPPMHGPGSRETLLVKRGSVVLAVDGNEHKLQKGDAVTFEADLPHTIKNAARGETEFIAVVSAGLRSIA